MWKPHSWVALSFADDATEAAFETHYTNNTLWSNDWRFLTFHLTSLALFLVFLDLGLAEAPPTARFWTLVTVVLLAAQYLGMWRLHKAGLLPLYRSSFMGVVRAVLVLVSPPLTTAFFKPAPTPAALTMSICVGSCCCLAVWHGLGIPFLFKHQLLHQLASITYWSHAVNAPICARVAASPASVAALDAVRAGFGAVFDTLFDIYFPALPHGFSPPPGPLACRPVVIQLQFMVGVLFPMCVIYKVELILRVGFLARTTGSGGADDAPHRAPVPMGRSSWLRQLLGASVMLLSSACLWQASNAFYASGRRAELV